MKKLIAFILLAAMFATIGLLAGCGGAKTNDKITVNEVTHSVFYAPQYVAMSLGFFAEEGIEIELVNGGGADKSMTALLSGGAQIGLMGPEAAIYVYNEGRENHAVIVGQVTKRDGSFLVGRKAEPDFKWESLKGTTVIGGRKGGVPEMTLEYVIKEHGLTPGVDLEINTSIQFNLMGGAFEGGTGDYVTLFEPVASAFELEGKGFIVASVGQESGEVPYTAYMVSKDYLAKNSALVERFLRALYKGQKWVAENPAEKIADAIKGSFPDTDVAILTKVAQRYKDIDAWMATPVMTKESFDKLQYIMTLAGELDKEAPFEDLVDNSIAEKVSK